jgi:O-antigen/teichoic acid export membrane protein
VAVFIFKILSILRKLAGQTIIYGASSILGRLLNYLLVPYYTYIFAAGEYGTITEFYAYAAFLNVLFTYGMETAYFRFATAQKDNAGSVFNQATSALLLSSILLSGILFVIATPLTEYLHYPGKEHYIRWFAGILAIDAIVAIPFARLRLENRPVYFAITKLVNIGLNIGLNIFFLSVCPAVLRGDYPAFLKPLAETVYQPGYSIEYVFLSNLLANAALLLLLMPVFSSFRFSFQWTSLRPMLTYAYPILFAGLAWVTNEMLSRWALRFWLPENFYPGLSNEAALGVFGAVYKFSVFMTLTVQAFRYAAEPFFFSRAADKNSPELFSKVSHAFIVFGCFVVLVISTNLDVLQYILQQEVYRQGMHVVPVLLFANLFLGIYYNVSIWYKITDKTYFSTWITGSAALFTILLNYLLIPVAGYEGSSWVTLLVYFGMAASCYWLGQRYYPIPYPLVRDSFYIILTVLGIWLINQLNFFSMSLLLSVRIMIYVLLGFLIYRLERNRMQIL